MPNPVVNIGDDFGNSVTITRGGSAQPIDASAVVKIAIVDNAKAYRMSAEVTLASGDTGNDWPSGVVQINIPQADQNSELTETDVIKNIVAGQAMIEVSIDDPTQVGGRADNTWHFPVVIAGAVIG